eukprot:scaffold35644_cov112-Isochrysis_galbana.AAC.1
MKPAWGCAAGPATPRRTALRSGAAGSCRKEGLGSYVRPRGVSNKHVVPAAAALGGARDCDGPHMALGRRKGHALTTSAFRVMRHWHDGRAATGGSQPPVHSVPRVWHGVWCLPEAGAMPGSGRVGITSAILRQPFRAGRHSRARGREFFCCIFFSVVQACVRQPRLARPLSLCIVHFLRPAFSLEALLSYTCRARAGGPGAQVANDLALGAWRKGKGACAAAERRAAAA